MTKSHTQQPAAPAGATTDAPPARVRVVAPFMFRHRGGMVHTFYQPGDEIVGADAEEMLSVGRLEVVRVGEPVPVRCPSCMGVLEEAVQLCSWIPGEGESPDRLDALVWALTLLVIMPDQGLKERLAAMTPAEREAYFARQNALFADAFRL